MGYKFRPEYIIDQGYYNNQYRIPGKEYKDFQAFQRREVAKLAKEMVDITHEWFCSDPVIPQKHHCLFAAFMCDVNHLFCKLCNFPTLECLEILVFFAWHTILVIMVTLIDDKFRTEFITDLSLKLL